MNSEGKNGASQGLYWVDSGLTMAKDGQDTRARSSTPINITGQQVVLSGVIFQLEPVGLNFSYGFRFHDVP